MPDRPPRSFRSPEALRRWMLCHPDAKELILRCFKVQAGNRGVTHREALDEALCTGWIDGVRRSFDRDSFTVRFTPRRPGSRWSTVNARRFAELTSEGRVDEAGRAAFERRGRRRSDPEGPDALGGAEEKRFKANAGAWKFFRSQAPWYRRICARFVMSARREETRERRLTLLISCSAKGQRIPPLDRSAGARASLSGRRAKPRAGQSLR